MKWEWPRRDVLILAVFCWPTVRGEWSTGAWCWWAGQLFDQARRDYRLRRRRLLMRAFSPWFLFRSSPPLNHHRWIGLVDSIYYYCYYCYYYIQERSVVEGCSSRDWERWKHFAVCRRPIWPARPYLCSRYVSFACPVFSRTKEKMDSSTSSVSTADGRRVAPNRWHDANRTFPSDVDPTTFLFSSVSRGPSWTLLLPVRPSACRLTNANRKGKLKRIESSSTKLDRSTRKWKFARLKWLGSNATAKEVLLLYGHIHIWQGTLC